MTVSNAIRAVSYTGSTSTGPFTFNFRVLSADDVAVTKISADGTRTLLETPASYSISLTNLGVSGGSITLGSALISTDILLIEGSIDIAQPTNYANQGGFYPETHENSFDRLTIAVQETRQNLDRNIRIAPEDDNTLNLLVPLVADRANKYLMFDADGNVSVSTFSVGATREADYFRPILTGPTLSDVALGLYKPASNVLGLAANSADAMRLTNPSSAVNYLQVTGAVSTDNATTSFGRIKVSGEGTSDVQILDYVSRGHETYGRAAHCFWADDALLFRVSADGVGTPYTIDRHIAIEPGSSDGAKTPSLRSMASVAYSATGNNFSNATTENIDLGLLACGRGSIRFYTRGGNVDTDPSGGAGTGGGTDVQQFLVSDTAAAVNTLAVTGSTTGNRPQLYSQGSDTNIDIQLTPKGSGTVRGPNFTATSSSIPANGVFLPTSGVLGLAASSYEVLRLQTSGTVVNYMTITSRATGSAPILSVNGSDTNIGMSIQTKGTGSFAFFTGSNESFTVVDTPSTVNRLRVTGSATGSAPQLYINGSDTNVDLALVPKGSGVLKFGTHSAIAAETVTGYITVKDSGGTSRKLAVVS